tara:strand:+ start:132 stop:731 length:600 start_codon:yes stop_codon:yes gene_type:complete
MRPGHVVSFNYDSRKTRKIPRLIFILNANDTRSGSRLVHGINLEQLSWSIFLKIIRKIIISDTITIIKRKYEIRGPLDEILDKPLIFYKRMLKKYIETEDVYRTYKYSDITNTKLWALDYSSFFRKTDENRSLLINEHDKLTNITEERKALYELFDISTGRLKDTKYRQLIIQRFGNEGVFKRSIAEINEMVDGNEDVL